MAVFAQVIRINKFTFGLWTVGNVTYFLGIDSSTTTACVRASALSLHLVYKWLFDYNMGDQAVKREARKLLKNDE